MLKLIIEIEEKNSFETTKYKAVGTNIHITEIGQKATKTEIDVSKILKDRLKVEEKFQIEDFSKYEKSKLKDELINLLKSL